MRTRLIWDEAKRRTNLAKHGLDVADAWQVLDSRYRLDVFTTRGGEFRVQSFAYVVERLAVLSAVHLSREDVIRVISYRYASEEEAGIYHEWLESEAPEA
jgi:hypothetical protein